MNQNRDEPTQERHCRILKSSFNNRQRRIESLRNFSNLFLNCSTTTPLNTCTKSTRRGIGGASTKKFITPKEKTSLIIRRHRGLDELRLDPPSKVVLPVPSPDKGGGLVTGRASDRKNTLQTESTWQVLKVGAVHPEVRRGRQRCLPTTERMHRNPEISNA